MTPSRRARTPRTIAIRTAAALIGAFVLVQILADQPLHPDGGAPPVLKLAWAGHNLNPCGPVVRIYPDSNTLVHLIRRERGCLEHFERSVGEVSFLIKSPPAAPRTIHEIGVRVLQIAPTTGIRAYPRPKVRRHCTVRGPGIPVDPSQAASELPMTAFKALTVEPSITPLPFTTSRTGTGQLVVFVVNRGGFIDYEWQIGVSWSAPTDPPGTRRWTAMPHRFRTSTTPLYSYTNAGQLRVEDPGSL